MLLRGRGERASGRKNKAAHFLSECTERRTNPREANHSEQLARGGGGRGVVSTRAQVREWVLSVALGHAASPRAEPTTQDPVRIVNCCFRSLALLLKIKHLNAELPLCAICMRSQIAHTVTERAVISGSASQNPSLFWSLEQPSLLPLSCDTGFS